MVCPTAPLPSSSTMVTGTERGLPARSPEGSGVPRATVKTSLAASSSWAVVMVPVPVVAPAVMLMLVSVPWSSGSAVPSVMVMGMVTAPLWAADRVAVTVTLEPSSTGLGEADRDTVSSTCAGAPERNIQPLLPTAFTARTRIR